MAVPRKHPNIVLILTAPESHSNLEQKGKTVALRGKTFFQEQKELNLFWNNSPVCHKEFSVFIIIRIQTWQNCHNHPQWQEWKRTHPREEWGVLPWEFLPEELSAAASSSQRVPMTNQSHIPPEFTLDNHGFIGLSYEAWRKNYGQEQGH